jgi:hypothetical protein
VPPLNLYARVRFSLCTLHTRPRVQRAPGIPCSLFEGESFANLGQIVPREGEAMSVATSPAVIARLDRATQYAAASRLKALPSLEYWIARS